MPLYGLLKDSPVLYAIQKYGRMSGSHRGGSGLAAGSKPRYAYKFRNLTLYHPQFDEMINGKNGPVGLAMAELGKKIERGAKRQVDTKTGRLRDSIHTRHTTSKLGHKLVIGSQLRFASAVHEGTKPHLISPNHGQFIRFNKGSKTFYTRMVHHPGTKANRYLSDQLRIHMVKYL